MSQKQILETLSNELQCEHNDTIVEETLAYWRDLSEVFQQFTTPDPSSMVTDEGVFSDDPYNSMLNIYETPRKPTRSGSLDGLSFAVKDNIAVRGLRMTCGLQQMDYVPSFDATVVTRLLEAGASLIGKTNMDAFALGPAGQWSEFDTVENPCAPDRVPGGSSSGSGAAVAGGLVDFALGTDTGGSIRSPAACCGIVGIRPTQRTVPRYGFVELVVSTDTIGPLARDVDTAATVLDAMAGADPRDRTTSPVSVGWLRHEGDLTVGVIRSTVDDSAGPVRSCIDNAIDSLAETPGTSVTSVELEFGNISKAFSICLGAEFTWLVRQSFTVRGHGVQYNPELRAALSGLTFNEHVANRVLPGALLDEKTDGMAYLLARQEIQKFCIRLSRIFSEVDVLLTPTLRILPPKFGEVQSSEDGLNYSFTKPFSLTGGPSVSVPVGAVDGLPVSAQVSAPPFEDGAAISTARLLEDVTPGFR